MFVWNWHMNSFINIWTWFTFWDDFPHHFCDLDLSDWSLPKSLCVRHNACKIRFFWSTSCIFHIFVNTIWPLPFKGACLIKSFPHFFLKNKAHPRTCLLVCLYCLTKKYCSYVYNYGHIEQSVDFGSRHTQRSNIIKKCGSNRSCGQKYVQKA